jgi:serine/threonine-protein kinase
VGEAADIAISILSALHKAHRHNIIHRDIKPQNIIMTSDNVPKGSGFRHSTGSNNRYGHQKD